MTVFLTGWQGEGSIQCAAVSNQDSRKSQLQSQFSGKKVKSRSHRQSCHLERSERSVNLEIPDNVNT